jgi:uncharacterized protein (TIGR00725 family)
VTPQSVAIRTVAIVGPDESASPEEIEAARLAGRELAAADFVIVTGGLGGVMGGAAEGVRDAGGTCIGLLPGNDASAGHPALTVAIPTGLGELRNGLVVRAADVVLAIGGSWGTLSEIALAMRTGVPVVRVGGWPLPSPGPLIAFTIEDAIDAILRIAGRP